MFSQSVSSNTNLFIYQCDLFLLSCKYSNYEKNTNFATWPSIFVYRYIADRYKFYFRVTSISFNTFEIFVSYGNYFCKKFLKKVSFNI